jgi:CheY-like chemotaxis protein
MTILIVEDVDDKYVDVVRCFRRHATGSPDVVRAENLNDAEDEVMKSGWSLMILDISMDISPSGSADYSAGHATMGGLDVLERMYLLKLDIPTVLVTGFDSFQDADRFDNAIMNLGDVDALAKGWLGAAYLGCVRYGTANWEVALGNIIQKWAKQ